MALIVQKFGGSSVADADKIFNVARRVTHTKRATKSLSLYPQWAIRQTI